VVDLVGVAAAPPGGILADVLGAVAVALQDPGTDGENKSQPSRVVENRFQ